jgi:hypothetical protein
MNKKFSFTELLVLLGLIISFSISGFIISEMLNWFFDVAFASYGSFDSDIKNRFNQSGVYAGIFVAGIIWFIYHQCYCHYKNDNKE